MTTSLRIRASIVLLLGTLLIPIVTSSLRGLTHVLSCASPVSARFDAEVPDEGEPPAVVILDPSQVTRPAPGATTTTEAPTTSAPAPTVPARPAPVCGGITVDMRLTSPAPGIVRIDLPVKNSGTHEWRGTVQLRVGSKSFPVELGSIAPGSTRTKSIEVTVDGDVQRVTGELLLGP